MPTHFQDIRIRLPEEEIYARLGFRKGRTSLTDTEHETVRRIIEGASDLVTLKGAALVLDIRRLEQSGVVLEDGTRFPSRSLAGMLEGSAGVLIMGATAGHAIMDAIASCSAQDLTRAVILDAVGSEMTDAALGWIMSYVQRELVRSAGKLTRKRFSAGYGDFSLENQLAMYELLKLDAIGIRLTPSRMLIPEKSVTAVAGVIRLT